MLPAGFAEATAAPPLNASVRRTYMEELRIPHVRVGTRGGRTVVEVPDDELRDMVEDYLLEVCDLEYEHLEPSAQSGRPVVMVFPSEVSLAKIVEALNELDPIEVDRVFRINNTREG
jgi:hypothetical protein